MSETRARILTADDLRSELVKGNMEVTLVLAAALNPTMFNDKIKICEPTDSRYSNYTVFEVLGSANAYALSFETILAAAARLYADTGKKCELLTNLAFRELSYIT